MSKLLTSSESETKRSAAGLSPSGLSEMPETPDLKLPDGQITTATRRKLQLPSAN
jgi:hypothetical protein